MRVLGGDIAAASFRNKVSSRIAYLPQGLGNKYLFNLIIFESADFFGRLFGQSRDEREPRIKGPLRQHRPVTVSLTVWGRQVSGGMKQETRAVLLAYPATLIRSSSTDPPTAPIRWRGGNPGLSIAFGRGARGRAFFSHSIHGRRAPFRIGS